MAGNLDHDAELKSITQVREQNQNSSLAQTRKSITQTSKIMIQN